MRRRSGLSRMFLILFISVMVVACEPIIKEEQELNVTEPAPTPIATVDITEPTPIPPDPEPTNSPPPLPTPEPTTSVIDTWQQIGNEATGLQILAPPGWINLSGQLDTPAAANELGIIALLLADSERTGSSLLGGKAIGSGAYVAGLISHLELPPSTSQATLNRLIADLSPAREMLSEPMPVTAVIPGGRVTGAYADIAGAPIIFPASGEEDIRTRIFLFTSALGGAVNQQTQAIFLFSAPATSWTQYIDTFGLMANTIFIHNIYSDYVIRDGSANVIGELAETDIVNGNLDTAVNDVWTFTLNQPRYATITLSPDDKDIDLTLTLVSPTGQTVNSIDNGYAGDTEVLIDTFLLETGLYIIEIGEFFDAPGRYTLSLVLTEEPLFGGGGSIEAGRTIQSDLPINGQHVWMFIGTAGELVSIVLTPESNFDAILDLYGPDGRRLMGLDEGFSGDAEVISGFELPVTGEYTILVRSFAGDGGSYALSLDTGGEDTLNFYDAGDMAYGDTKQETLRANEAHAWFFTGKAGDQILVKAMPIDDALDLDIWLLDPNVDRLVTQDEFLKGMSESITFTLPEDGQYLVLVRDFFGETGRYQIQLTADPAPVPVAAGSLDYGEMMPGTLMPGQMVIWYFDAREGDVIDIELEAAGQDQDLLFTLYDPNDNQVWRMDDAGIGETETLSSYRITEEGEWGVVVQEFYGEESDYTLTISRSQ